MQQTHRIELTNCLGKLQSQGGLADVRAEVASEICGQFKSGNLNHSENKLVLEIITLLAGDIEKKVRLAIANNLKDAPNIPRAIATKLAKDILEVALPILEFSPALTNEDLLDIIRSASEVARFCAIAKRKNITEGVADELMSKMQPLVVKMVVNNRGAVISARSLGRIISELKAREDILEDMINRGNLPIIIVERLLSVVSNRLKERLLNEYKISAEAASLLLQGAQDKIILDSIKSKTAVETDGFVKVMSIQRKLSPSLVLQALCKGNMLFFESSIAYLSEVPLPNVRKLLYDKSTKGFSALYKTTNLPEDFFEATRVFLEFSLQEREKAPAKDYLARVKKMIVAEGLDKTIANMKILLAMMDMSEAQLATLH